MNEIKNGAAYIRVSTDRQEELSPAAQERMIIDYAKKNHIILDDTMIFKDLGISGTKVSKRSEFQNMISMAKSDQHPIDVILVWKFSRFARNQEESIVYKNLLKKKNVEVISISEPIIDGPFGTLIERIIEWMDEYYSINLGHEVMRGMTEKALKGGYQATSPLGYKTINHIPEIYEPEAVIVRSIFKQFISGYDITVVARNINDIGYRSRRGNLFEYRTVKYILENPFYIGKVRWNRAKHSSYVANAKEEVIIADGKHEALISEKDFNIASDLLKQYTLPGTKRRSATVCKHWLSGLIKCPVCGASLSYNSYTDSGNKTVYPHWQCYKYNKGFHRGSQYVSDRVMTEAVLRSMNNMLTDSPSVFTFSIATDEPNLVAYSNQLKKIDQKLKRIKAAYVDGIDTISEYKSNKAVLQEERHNIEKLIKEAKKVKNIGKQDMINRIRIVYDILVSDSIAWEKKATLIRGIVEKIEFDRENNECHIFYIYT